MKKILIFFVLGGLLLSCQESVVSVVENEHFITISDTVEVKQEVTYFVAPKRISFDSFRRAIPVPEVTPTLQAVFNASAIGDFVPEYTQPDMVDTLDGYVTDNQAFFDQVLAPAISPYLDSLKNLQKYQAINVLTLFIYESYIDFFGNSFYRWGGDITDRDQPQTASSHSTSVYSYGMDCSGFGASPFEAAVQLEILDSTQAEAAFSWMGFKYICDHNVDISDGGGRSGSTNNFRMEVSDMSKVGTLITTIAAGTTPTDAQIALMQAGDVVIKSGHMGILVEVEDEVYFLESGGSTVNEEGLYTPYRAKEALADFASSRTTTIRRCLPNKETSSSIVHY